MRSSTGHGQGTGAGPVGRHGNFVGKSIRVMTRSAAGPVAGPRTPCQWTAAALSRPLSDAGGPSSSPAATAPEPPPQRRLPGGGGLGIDSLARRRGRACYSTSSNSTTIQGPGLVTLNDHRVLVTSVTVFYRDCRRRAWAPAVT